MLQTQYYQQALQSFHSNNLKLCLIYLKKLKTWDRKSIELLVDSSYSLWQQLQQKSLADEEAARVVQESFVLLLSNNISNELIIPWDYLRLSHVYIVQGNLHGAAQIMNLASSKGHMESILIVTQSCFIMNGLQNENEVQRYISFLSSCLLDLSAQTKTNEEARDNYSWQNGLLPYYYLYVICATFLQKREIFRHERDKKQTLRDYNSLLHDGYFYATRTKERNTAIVLNWYQDFNLWLRCAESLDSGPLLLLAEAFYWEAYIRAPLLNESISKLLHSMRVHGRKKDIPILLAKALAENQWNIISRDSIREIEVSSVADPNNREWIKMFDAEEGECTKIQCRVRGWILRRKWPMMLPKLKETRRNHLEKMQLADDYYENYHMRYHFTLVHRWKEYIEDWKELKWNSALRLQTVWRCKISVWKYREMLLRVKAANRSYFILCQHYFVHERMKCMRKWQQHYTLRKKCQATKVIADFLFLHGYNQKLVKGMNEVLGVLRVWYKHIKKRAWRHWMTRFRNRQKKHARVTIRFYLRDMVTRMEEKKQEEQLKVVEQAIAAKKEVEFERNHLPMLRSSFAEWFRKFQDRLKHKTVIKMVYTLQHKYFQQKAKERLRVLVLRREAQRAFCNRRSYRTLSTIIGPWQVNAAALRLQRFVRQSLARKIYRRLKNIDTGVRLMIDTRLKKKRVAILWRWRKYVFLEKREQLRAIRHVLYTFRRVVLKSKLRRIGLRKPKLFHFLESCHLKMLLAYFRFVRDKAKVESRLKGAQTVLSCVYKMSTLHAVTRWRHQLSQQHQLQSLRRLFVNQPIDREYWLGAHLSVEVRSHKGSSQRDQAAKAGIHPTLKWEFHPWEKYVPARLHLLDVTTLIQAKAFRAWMAQYRRCQQFRFDGAYYQARFFQTELFDTLQRRAAANLVIQTWFRSEKSRRLCLRMQQVVRWAVELHVRKQQLKLYRCWEAVKSKIQQRQRAWPIVAAALRINVAKKRKCRLRNRHLIQLQLIAIINQSRFQQVFLRKYLQEWVITYCRRVLLPSYNMEKSFQRKRRLMQRQRGSYKGNSIDTLREDDGDGSRINSDTEIDEDGDLNPRLRKLLKYQKRLQQRDRDKVDASSMDSLRSNSMTSLSSHASSMSTIQPASKPLNKRNSLVKGGETANSLSRYVSSGIMFFRSEQFHRILQQVRLTQLFIYDSSIAPPALHPQEIYYLLQQSSVVILKGWNFIAQDFSDTNNYQQSTKGPNVTGWKHVCNAFRGSRIMVEGGCIHLPSESNLYYQSMYSSEERQLILQRRQQFCEYMQDLILGKRSLYESELIDRSKWPLSIPTSALAELKPVQQSFVSPVMHWKNVRISHCLALYIARLFSSGNETRSTAQHPRSHGLESYSGSSINLASYEMGRSSSRDDYSAHTILEKSPSFSVLNKSAISLFGDRHTNQPIDKQEPTMLVGVVEWSIDFASAGSLGILLTMMAIKSCRFLKRLKIFVPSEVDFDSNDNFMKNRNPKAALFATSASFHTALRMLSECPVLEELEIRGRMTQPALLTLQETLQHDFVSLARLQLEVAAEDLEFAQAIVDAAKLRSYSTMKQGVSIFIDEL